MCGFVGFTRGLGDEKTLKRMADRLDHRGPDASKEYIDEKIGLGFRRLRIIDLSCIADQPMSNEDESLVMVFNGEIYNFKELRIALEALGHKFVSSSDSEVILRGYEEYGIEIIPKLRGMFAIAIYDKKEERIILARDYFGIKPLYYTTFTSDQSLIFGSEIKALLAHPAAQKEFNPDALRPYLTFQTSALNETFFKGIYKLPPAHILSVDLRGKRKMNLTKYWTANFEPESRSLEENVERIKEVMQESVTKHKISDVKVGSFLSGGIDSSYVTALLKPDKTFSVGFYEYEEMFDETKHAKRLSELLGIENHSITLTSKECFDAIETIQYHMDEPHSNPSAVPLYFLSKLAREHVTVVLSGEGADEVFAGYPWYRTTAKMQRYEKLPMAFRRAIAKGVRHLPESHLKTALIRSGQSVEQRFIGHAIVFTEKEALRVLRPKYRKGRSVRSVTQPVYDRIKGKDDLTKMQFLDFNIWQPNDILQKADKMSMAHSLELRVPFLDKRVMALAETLPVSHRISVDDTKVALRAAALEVLPDEWANRPKLGFPVPIKYWLREEEIAEKVKRAFQSEAAGEFFDTTLILQYLEKHRTGLENHARHIWTVYCFLVWYEQYFGKHHRYVEDHGAV